MATEVLRSITQPDILRPDFEDHFTWASLRRTYTEWVRFVGPQLGLNTTKLVLGDVLRSITADDSNCFYWALADFLPIESAIANQKSLLERLDWEISTPETPTQIRERLELVRTLVTGQNWANREEFDMAKASWYRAKKYVEDQIKQKPKLKSSLGYVDKKTGQLAPYWRMFCYGKVVN